MACTRSTPIYPFERALQTVKLSPTQEVILRERYVPLILNMRHRARRLTCLFFFGHTSMTIGSLLVPALLSIQYSTASGDYLRHISLGVYWATWLLSLYVTIINGLMTLFKMDKRYYLAHTMMEQMTSEGWQYLMLTSKYSGFFTPKEVATHQNQFVFFCHAIEKIRMKQVQEEYYKLNEKESPEKTAALVTGASGAAATAASNTATMIPITPLKRELANLPTEILQAVQQQISAAMVDGAGPPGRRESIAAPAPRTTSTRSTDSKDTQESQENGETTPVPVHAIVPETSP